MLLRYAKLAGGLRLLIATAAPLVVTSVSLLTVRTAAYLVGFGLGSILSIWLPVVLTLVSLTGAFDGNSDTSVCEAYRAQLRAIDERNAIILESYNRQYEAYLPSAYAWMKQYDAYSEAYWASHGADCEVICAGDTCTSTSHSSCGFLCSGCMLRLRMNHDIGAPPPPDPPPYPELEGWGSSGDGCGSETPPDCPDARKVWLQVLWASPGGKASDSKGCFIVAYSQDAKNLPADIQYNPYKLPEQFVRQQALRYELIAGNRFYGVNSELWKDLDSSSGWDKGYWAAEQVDIECRGWRPGWSLKVK